MLKLYVSITALLLIQTVCSFNVTEYVQTIIHMSTSAEYNAEFEKLLKKNIEIEPNYMNFSPFLTSNGYKFECEKDSDPTIPTSVHRLRPQDVKVMGALGDSLTAALGAGASTILGLSTEYRGLSWSIGGDDDLEDVVSLANILKKFNPNVFGFNTGTTFMPTTKQGKGFNVAVSGQEANHMDEQAQRLVDRMRASKDISFENDWKMITLFIGGNDLCDYCKDKALHSPKQYITDITAALDILYKSLPKTFVNLVTVLNVNEVKQLNLNLVCNGLHKVTCPCASYPDSDEEEKELIEVQTQYQNLIEELVNSGKYDGRDDFTVVVQPFFKGFSIPKLPDGDIDTSLFAPDCFHLSRKGQASAAIGLWNNLLQPVGKKQTASSADEPIICPSKGHPYFYTAKN